MMAVTSQTQTRYLHVVVRVKRRWRNGDRGIAIYVARLKLSRGCK